MTDGTFRAQVNGTDAGQMTMVGTFAEHAVVPKYSLTKIDEDIPFPVPRCCSCGCPPLGSAEYGAEVHAGDTVIVMGTGGVGMNAVQAAAARGAAQVIAVDPVAFKREAAAGFGATHRICDIDEAADFARSVTGGQGAHAAIVTVGVTTRRARGAGDQRSASSAPWWSPASATSRTRACRSTCGCCP